MSKKRRTAYLKVLPKGPLGYNLCRCGCKQECIPPRLTFFSAECVHSYRLRSDPTYLRKAVFLRDKGVCSKCKLDCELLRLEMAVLKHKDKNKFKKKMHKLRWPANRKTYWDAHHVLAVVDGGGECGIDNMATLCVNCHKTETDELNLRLQDERSRDKQLRSKRARQNNKRARRKSLKDARQARNRKRRSDITAAKHPKRSRRDLGTKVKSRVREASGGEQSHVSSNKDSILEVTGIRKVCISSQPTCEVVNKPVDIEQKQV